jgi:hypothetical protein
LPDCARQANVSSSSSSSSTALKQQSSATHKITNQLMRLAFILK